MFKKHKELVYLNIDAQFVAMCLSFNYLSNEWSQAYVSDTSFYVKLSHSMSLKKNDIYAFMEAIG